MANVIVKFTDSNGETKNRVTDTDGVASLKNVLLGDYKVTIEKGYSSAVITKSEYNLTAKENSLTLVLRDEDKSMDIYGSDIKGESLANGAYACAVSVGTYSVHSNAGETRYLVFNAQNKGVYKFTVTSSDATVGYYGGPMYVQSSHVGIGEYDGKSFEIIVQDSLTPYIIGVTSNSEIVSLVIERISDAPFDPEYLKWTNVSKEADIENCVIPEGTTLKNFDITDNTLTVVERDGLYYTTDGKLVYIRIKSSCDAYLPGASLAYLAGYVDQQIGINIGGYVYDEQGNFVDKLSYNRMIKDYMSYCDTTYGVVPLTKDLAECIQLHGRESGWWNSGSSTYLFTGHNVVEENTWLFLCMIEE